MSFKVLIHDYPHRTLALATEDHVLVFRHAHTQPETSLRIGSQTSLSSVGGSRHNLTPRCMVEFSEKSALDLSHFHPVASAKGTLGVITLNNDVFLCVITGAEEVATVRPGETVQKIYSVDFYCLNRADYDHAHGPYPNPYPGQTFQSDDVDYGGGYDQADTTAEHPFHALRKLLSGGNFYYSVDFDLTRRLQDRVGAESTLDITSLDEGLLWNSYMINPLLKFRSRLADHEQVALDHSRILTSVIRGFVKTLPIPSSSSPIRGSGHGLPTTLTVISRLSSRRAGTRFNSRGIDDNGNVANFVETETVFWSPTGLCFSYTQIRGSIPVFWESSSSLIPGQQKIQITRSPEATQPSFDKHFSNLERTYGAVHIVNLLSAFKPGEVELTERYRHHIARSPLRQSQEGELEEHHLMRETEFDFHERTKTIGYEGAKAIKPFLDDSAESFVYFLSEEIVDETVVHGKTVKVRRPVVVMQQNGVFRVNCLDCLDRTNLIQGLISQMAIELFLSHRDERANSDFWMRHSALWADNGDTLSKIYAGTGALKSSFTRHGKMSLAGAFADARKSATRLYVNHFEDKSRQNTVDLLLGRLVGQSSVDLYDPVNDWVVAEVNRRRAEFETRDHIKIFMGTYNLNGKTSGAGEDLSQWLDVHGKGFDVVTVGFQEIVELSPQQIMSTDPNRRMLWETAVRNCLNGAVLSEKSDELSIEGDQYVLLRSGQLVGAALLIFVRSSLLGRIKNVEGAIKKTGMSGIAGNKGAVAIRMDIESTSVCFVTAHLAAGFGNYEERNRDYNTITSGLRFQRNRGIEDHEIVVWAGDFNYRIGLGYDKTKAIVNEAIIGNERIREEALGKLYENDQLNIQMVAGNCFNFYREGRVRFLPTYKYDIGRDDFDSSDKQRIPAWTDRVLWKVNHNSTQLGEDLGSKMKQLDYNSVMSLKFSDHRPVFATFEMGVRVIDEATKEALIKKLYTKKARDIKLKGTESTEDFSDLGSEEDETESVMGYESIQEGLPPASSDKRKWWLDGNKGARSVIRPPQENMALNKHREANPWKDSSEDDWVEVKRPLGSNGDQANASTSRTQSRASTRKPLPPPARRRMVPPAWDGERMANPTEIKPYGRSVSSAPHASSGSRSRADSSPLRNTNISPTAASSSLPPPRMPERSSSSATITRKAPPPKPAKPMTLTTSASQVAVPNVSLLPGPVISPLAPISRSDVSVSQDHPSPRQQYGGGTDGAMDSNDDAPPPPLPRRTGTASSTASSYVSAQGSLSHSNSISHSTHHSFASSVSGSLANRTRTPSTSTPPPSLTRITQLQKDGGVGKNSGESPPGPPLPPRRDTNGAMSVHGQSRSATPVGTSAGTRTRDLMMDDDVGSSSDVGASHSVDTQGRSTTGSALDKYKPLLPS
ncbi:hypothetical protein PV10_02289 [Exophiala mesophila]|uniref:phosphoinositide 5-phosphatase n=1 Tax=Exophiala mesophila TaxID=212818 RepID=A0A0D2A6F9_EXOME|nr:uncharacterized protein PV10_02289 [Exophiala mesophila]KIV94533.1 hypothetical protein PV10_02289 [Exophiala mesophila]